MRPSRHSKCCFLPKWEGEESHNSSTFGQLNRILCTHPTIFPFGWTRFLSINWISVAGWSRRGEAMMKECVGVLRAPVHPLCYLRSQPLPAAAETRRQSLAVHQRRPPAHLESPVVVFFRLWQETEAGEREVEVRNSACVCERESPRCTNPADTFLLWKALHTVC